MQRVENEVLLTAGLAWAASLIHLQAAIDHFDEYWLYAVFFIGLAAAQCAWGIAICRRPRRGVLVVGAVGSIAVAVLWLASRTVGLPIGPDVGNPETVGVLDAIATADELAIGALLWLSLRGPGTTRSLGKTATASAAVLLLVVSSLALAGGLHAH